jgi:hypothetical protein
MKYLGKVTSQLSINEFEQIKDLFTDVFDKPVSIEKLQTKYCAPLNNNSYHGLMLNDDNLIVGTLTIIPFEYNFFNAKTVFGCAVDLMVHKSYRKDITSMKKMYAAAINLIGKDIDFLYAIPNQNSYLYFKKILGWDEIGKLNYYIMPLNASKLLPRLKGLDFFSKIVAAILNGIKWPIKMAQIQRPITKIITPAFLKYRFPQYYKTVEKSGKCAYYTIVNEASIITAYIIDLCPLTSEWLSEVTRDIWRNERQNIDLIIYIGIDIPFMPNLFKIPLRYEPRTLHFIGKVINPDKIDHRINHIKNWQFNLSDFDVR